MYIGERLVGEKRYAEALPYLEETVRIAPDSDKAVLLTAKAALSIGEVEVAQKALQGHDGGKFEDEDSDVVEVKALWTRALGAFEKADQAVQLGKEGGHDAEAARLMHGAAASYPEAPKLATVAEMYDEGAAFERKDYDAFLALAEKLWKEDPSASTASQLASALACKYAVTGDMAYRKQSEDMLQKAEREAKADPEAMKNFQEYSERIRYRLNSRQIIDTQEYDRRFRGGKQK